MAVERLQGGGSEAPPHLDRDDRTRIELYEWTGCGSGGPVMLYRVSGGGHMPPSLAVGDAAGAQFGRRSRDAETAQETWRGFAAVKPLNGR